MRHYLRIAASTFLFTMIVVAAFTRLIDPAGYWGGPIVAGLNAYKPASGKYVASVKLRQVARVRPATIVAGNSRVDIGIDPMSPAWPASERPVYNLGLPGVKGDQVIDTVLRALEVSQPKRVILAVDFIDFPIDERTWRADNPTPNESVEGPSGAIQQQIRMLLSFDILFASFAAIPEQWKPHPAHITPAGFNPAAEYADVVDSRGHDALFEELLRESVDIYAGGPKKVAWPQPGGSDQWRALGRLAAGCRRRGVELVVVTYPYHAQLLLTFARTGLWPAYEDWQRKLAAFSAGERVPAWSFNHIGPETTETVVQRGQRLRFYWEAAHFKSALGDRMVETLYGARALGAPLSLNSIEANLASDRQRLEEYRARNPGAARRIDRLVAEHSGWIPR